MEIHIARDGQRFGPFPVEEVHRQLATGTLRPTDLAWREGAAGWAPISAYPEFASATGQIPPLTTPAAPRSFAPVAPAAPGSFHGAPSTSGVAVSSLICGLLSITLVPLLAAIPAIICGHLARGSIRKSAGRLTGDGMAVAGLVLGYCCVGFFLLMVPILAGIALPVFSQVQLKGKETKSLSNAKMIAVGCKLYAVDHNGAFPKKLDELVPDYLPNRDSFVCPLSPTLPLGYDYFGGTDSDPPEKILLMSKFADRQGRRIFARVDTSAMLEKPPAAQPLPLTQ